MAAGLVGASAQERDASRLRRRADDRQLFLGLGPLEPLQIARPVLGPGDLLVEERAQQRHDGAELLEPEVHAVLADPPRPEAHDEDAGAVRRRRRIVDALDRDHVPPVSIVYGRASAGGAPAPRRPAARTAARWNLSHGAVSSARGVNHTKSKGRVPSKPAA